MAQFAVRFDLLSIHCYKVSEALCEIVFTLALLVSIIQGVNNTPFIYETHTERMVNLYLTPPPLRECCHRLIPSITEMFIDVIA